MAKFIPYDEYDRLKREKQRLQKELEIAKQSNNLITNHRDTLYLIFRDLIYGYTQQELMDKYHLNQDELKAYLKALTKYMAHTYTDRLIELKDQFIALSHERYNIGTRALLEILADPDVRAGTKVRAAQALREYQESQLAMYEKLGVLEGQADSEELIEELQKSKTVLSVRKVLEEQLFKKKKKKKTEDVDEPSE